MDSRSKRIVRRVERAGWAIAFIDRVAAAFVVAVLTIGCTGAPATPGASSATPAAASAKPSAAAATPATTTIQPTPSASISITGWMHLPTSDALTAAAMYRVVAGPAGLLAVGSRGGSRGGSDVPGFASWWSRDGIAWSRSEAAGTAFAGDAVALSDGFAILGKVGDGSDQERAMIWRSSDGVQWTGSPIRDLKTGPFAADRIGGRISAFAIRAPAGGEPTLAWSSSDFVSWTSDLLGGGGFSSATGMTALADGSGLAFGRWSGEPIDVAPFAPGQAAFWRSTDGRTWLKTAVDPDFRDALVVDVAQAPGPTVVAVGQRWDPTLSPDQPYTLAVWSSSDGRSWEPAAWLSTVDPTWVPLKVAPAGSGVVLLAAPRAGGASALIARSSDGLTWTAIDPPIVFDGGQANDLVAVDRHLVVVGQTLPPAGTAADAAVWIGPATTD